MKKKQTGYKYRITKAKISPLQPNKVDYPYQKKSPSMLVRFLYDLNERKRFDLLANRWKLQSHVKELLKEHDADSIIKATIKCYEVSKYPFTFKFVETLLNEPS
jgi:hypothetical protein